MSDEPYRSCITCDHDMCDMPGVLCCHACQTEMELRAEIQALKNGIIGALAGLESLSLQALYNDCGAHKRSSWPYDSVSKLRWLVGKSYIPLDGV